MKALYKFFRNYPYVFGTISVLLIGVALGLAKLPDVRYGLFVVWGLIIVFNLGRDMIATLKSGSYGVDLVAIVAIISTLAVGEIWASMIIVLMLTGGEALEEYAARRAKRELSDLMARAPKIAHLKSGPDIPIDEVKIGDVLLIKPLEIIPVDGQLISQVAVIDESSLTGESTPAEYKKGEKLLSGSLNGDTAIIIKATKTASESEYQKIVQLVEAASSTDAPFIRLADRYAVPFTIISFVIAGLAWFLSGDAVRFAEVLVVATPCPLILATPIALISGMSRAAKNGIIIKSGAILEKLSRVKSAAFDKTGTLTHGTLSVKHMLPVDGVSENELLQAAATVEQQSSHIIATAIVNQAKSQGMKLPKLSKATDTPAFGVEVEVGESKILAGKLEFLHKKKIIDAPKKPIANLLGTLVYVAKDNKYIGVIDLEDELRDNAKSTIEDLRHQGISYISMLTGDNQTVADVIAKSLKIEHVVAHCLPADKVAVVEKAQHRPIMMVGDGVNDAPVLAAADVGIAMGAKGSTAASETADVVIMLDDISRVSDALQISRRTFSIATQSILIGIFLSIGLMIIAAFGYIPAVVGALLQEVIDIAVIVNALRALR